MYACYSSDLFSFDLSLRRVLMGYFDLVRVMKEVT